MIKLHFLPVDYRIKFKISLLAMGSLHYLATLIKLRNTCKYSVRLDDYFLLEYVSVNIKRSEGAFSYQAPKIWNKLPYELRSLNDLSKFKRSLKSYYFKAAYSKEMNITI